MHRWLRWSIAVIVPLAFFAGIWYAWEALKLPPSNPDTRLAVALGVAGAVAVVVGAPLAWWAGREAKPSGINISSHGGLLFAPGADFRHAHVKVIASSTSGSELEIVSSPPPAFPLIVGELPRPPIGFQERPQLLAQISQIAPICVLISGRGTGKTQVAASYARQRNNAAWKLVAWLNAEQPGQVVIGLAQLSERLGLGTIEQDLAASAKRALTWLESQNEPCLLVFDDAVDPDEVKLWSPSLGSTQTVITTNNQAFGNFGQLVDIPEFTEAESIALLTRRITGAYQQGARELANELGRLPLALAQAEWVIYKQKISCADYQERLHRLPIAKLLRPVPGQSYPRGVAETVLVAIDEAERSNSEKHIRSVLGVLSLLSSNSVTRSWLYQLLSQRYKRIITGIRMTRIQVDNTLGQLAEISLITFSEDGASVRTHRLVQRVVRDRARQEGTLYAFMFQVLQYLMRLYSKAGPTWDGRARFLDWVDQLSAIRETAFEMVDQGRSWYSRPFTRWVDNRIRRALLKNLIAAVSWLNSWRDIWRAIPLAKLLVSNSEMLYGNDARETITARYYLAASYYVAMDFRDSTDLLEQALRASRRTLGLTDPDTLRLQSQLAIVYRRTDRVDDAIRLLESSIADETRAFGEHDSRVLEHRVELADSYATANRVPEGIDLLERTLQELKATLGEENAITLHAQGHLVNIYEAAGRRDEAIELVKQTIATEEKVLGGDHPETLAARRRLTDLQVASGGGLETIDEIKRTLEAQRKSLGVDHPDTLVTQHRLGDAYSYNGYIAEAIKVFQQTLKAQERVVGRDHPTTVETARHLEFLLSQRQGGSRASDLQRRSGSKDSQRKKRKHRSRKKR